MQIHMFEFPGSGPDWISDLLAGALGVLIGSYPLDRQIYPQLHFRLWGQQIIAWWGLRFSLWAVFIVGIALMPEKFEWRTILVAGGCLCLQALLLWGLFLKYLRLVKFLKPAGSRLQQIVNATTERMGSVNVRAAWEMEG